MFAEVKFAGTIIEVEDEVVAKVTSFSRSLSINEEEVTGAEDVIPGSDILQQQFVSVSMGETASVEGIAIEDASGLNAGQSELRDAAETGAIVVLRHTRNTGYGHALTGFFTAYDESGSVSGVYTFSGTFRVTDKSEITPGS